MALQGEYEPSPESWVRDQVEKYESSGGTEATTLRGVPVVVVTSVGAKSGKLRKNPVMRVEHEGSYALVASKGGSPEHPSWYRNIVTHPTVELQDHAEKATYRTRVLQGAEREEWWRRAIEVWPDYEHYQERTSREIPVFLAERDDSGEQRTA